MCFYVGFLAPASTVASKHVDRARQRSIIVLSSDFTRGYSTVITVFVRSANCEEISVERLNARPVTTLCIECKEEQEDMEKKLKI